MSAISADVTRLTKEIKILSDQITSLEAELAATGSSKTVEDVQEELDAVTSQIRANEKAREALMQTRERQSALIRKYEDEFKSMTYDLRDLQGKLREKKSTEDSLESLKRENVTMNSRLKKVDGEIEEAQEPKRELEATYKAESLARKAKIDEAQQLYQEYNMNVDKLQTSNKAIERFMREGVERKLQDCAEKKEDLEAELNEFTQRINEAKAALESLDLEARSGESTLANLRQNIQFRKLAKQITSTQSEIDAFDMEEAAKARRNFEEKYPKEKEREEQLHSKLAHLGGELSSQKQQLKEWDDDLKDFKDIYKKYTDQLITVKMSDMANNDLEKYAKALDNAIMKYHTLKMEEVNDTMKHLWNKTYQGTGMVHPPISSFLHLSFTLKDIDGIRIRADSEGGTTKRSYNYRVRIPLRSLSLVVFLISLFI
jgi:DNA repair protein RAD50